MKIGYPCINRTIKCKGDRTFRLKSYSNQRLVKTVESNLACLAKMLRFNVIRGILFFRITSDLVPFASHPICKFNWQQHFKKAFAEIGDFIKTHDIRISMHPDQFTLINSLDAEIFQRSCKELLYHAQVLDLMNLDTSAKIQIHIGGVYGNRTESARRFAERFAMLDDRVRKRLVVENDDLLYSLRDCLTISTQTDIPILFDAFHHQINNSGESLKEALKLVTPTWKTKDGLPMLDYSSRLKDGSKRQHAESIDFNSFRKFLKETKPFDFDVMLEIKDKEKSAVEAVKIASWDNRFVKAASK